MKFCIIAQLHNCKYANVSICKYAYANMQDTGKLCRLANMLQVCYQTTYVFWDLAQEQRLILMILLALTHLVDLEKV